MVVRQTRCRWWGIVVVGSILLFLGQSLDSEGAIRQVAKKQPPTETPKNKQKLHVIAQKTESTTSPAKVQSKKSTSSSRKAPLRARQQQPRSRRLLKRAQRNIAPRYSYQSSPLSLSKDSPPLPPRETFAAALLVDAETGKALFSLNDHREWPTASLAKMMVALLTFEAMERGEMSLSTPILISKRAGNEGGRQVHLRPGEEFPLEELLQATMVTSANDAAIAIAERLYGSVEACVVAMNQRARQLGMNDTLYRTPNGLPLPDGTPPDISSAADQAILARILAKHHLLLEWTSLNRVPFREGRTSLPNTNRLVGQVPGVDGLKTGFTVKARYNLVTTAQRGSLRLIAVVLGGRSSRVRFHTAANLLEWGFTNYPRINVIKSEKPLGEVKIEQGGVFTLRPIAVLPTVRLQDIPRTYWFPVRQ